MAHNSNFGMPHTGKLIGADMPFDSARYPIRELLSAYRALALTRPDVRLILAGRRIATDSFSVWNYLDENGLVDRVEFLPYYDTCRDFPFKKSEVDVWVSRETPSTEITAPTLLARLDHQPTDRPRTALFFTSFHPGKYEGNSRLMRLWLDYLKGAGYRVHVVYYMFDRQSTTFEMRRRALREYDLYLEVDVESNLVGRNRNGLNVHVDDWCGQEAVNAVADLVDRFEYDVAIVNYPFMTAVFNKVAAYTRKVLVTHDSFTDRNRRMLATGFSESGWASIDERGERMACRRADVVVALQDDEADYFRRLCGDASEVRVIAPVLPPHPQLARHPGEKLRIGYFGASNWVNELNFGEYLKSWLATRELAERSELVIAGGMCATLTKHVPEALVARAAPRMLGSIDRLDEFFDACDLVINPERGGTGIKIKTLEAMAHGAALVSTRAGAVGIGSQSRFHAAKNAEALGQLTAEIIVDRSLLDTVRRETAEAYHAYSMRHSTAMGELLGPARCARPTPVEEKSSPKLIKLNVPDYVLRMGAEYHIDEFKKFFDIIDVRGKRVLEIGSDFHLATARLFAANGAEHVVATNIGDWHSDEPTPANVEFRVGDVGDIDADDLSFDIVYGIAILEHIPDLEKVAVAIRRLLRPTGIAYLQGCPLWPGTLGHHVFVTLEQVEDSKRTFSSGGGQKSIEVIYSFADPAKNPIPNWAHLALKPNELADLLVDKGVGKEHAQAIIRYVFNTDRAMTGSCSNYMSASEIISTFENHFQIDVDRIISDDSPNEFFEIARAQYGELDLRTLGLRAWMRPIGSVPQSVTSFDEPKVSIVIPFYNVEDYIEECLKSVVNQAYSNLEIVLVDDASPDRSRLIAERLAAVDDRIRIVTHKKNRGLGPARNSGARHATGSYLLFLDSDDRLSAPSAVGTLVSAAKRSGCNVVVGSCETLLPDGSIEEFDRKLDKSFGGKPGGILKGLDAYLATMCIHGYSYLPARSWGSLIDRIFYKDLDLEFPAGEHEDLSHTPFLYHQSGGVYYEPAIVVSYRKRNEGISNTPWSVAKMQRYVGIWCRIKANIERFGLKGQLGDAAIKTAEHLIWKLECNGLDNASEEDVIAVLEVILRDAKRVTNKGLFFYALDNIRRFCGYVSYDFDLYQRLTSAMPVNDLLEYYSKKLIGEGVPVLSAPAVKIAPPELRTTVDLPLESLPANEARVSAILAEYEEHGSDALKSFPSMLTTADKALYFYASKHFGFNGAIVDGGCFVGGTTISLVEGLQKNPDFALRRSEMLGVIRVYDLFEIDDDYILTHLKKNYPGQEFKVQTSFLRVFSDNLKDFAELLDVRPGDVTKLGYHDEQPIEIFGVDFCKALPITDLVLREFFPRLLPGGLVIQQDFIHEFHPHIHLSMLRLQDHFEKFVEVKWGGSVAYKCCKPITRDVIRTRFGNDASWYGDVEANAALLRQLIDDMLYDENRWVMILTLGIYYYYNGRQEAAHACYREARACFPQFKVSELTTRMIGA